MSAPDHLTPAHGPSRVPGVRRTDAQEGLGGRVRGAQGADGSVGGSGAPDAAQGHAAAHLLAVLAEAGVLRVEEAHGRYDPDEGEWYGFPNPSPHRTPLRRYVSEWAPDA